MAVIQAVDKTFTKEATEMIAKIFNSNYEKMEPREVSDSATYINSEGKNCY